MNSKNTYSLLQKKKATDFELSAEYCLNWFRTINKLENFSFTKSCTQSLELSLLLLDFPLGSEVIMPSYSFVSLGNAVNNFGLKCIFIDCEEYTMNIDVNQIEQAISQKTKAIVTINYGGISCDYGKIKALCDKYSLYLIEDNAHGLLGKYQDKFLGSLGDISCFSFDHLKNFTCFQGGGISINNKDLVDGYQITSEFGTNRKDCLAGSVNFYEWKNKGTNSALAAPLYDILRPQLASSSSIISKFNSIWSTYQQSLTYLERKELVKLVRVPDYAQHNAHMFWIKARNAKESNELISYLNKNGIPASSHYVPLHTSSFGKIIGEFRGDDLHTSTESSKLVRLPMHLALEQNDILLAVDYIEKYFNKYG